MGKDDYSSVFRNIRTDRTTDHYNQYSKPDPAWMMWLGGIFAGIAVAFVLYLWAATV